MPAHQLCQKFFQTALTPFHQSLSPVSDTICLVLLRLKRIDRLLGNAGLHDDIPLIFLNITAMHTRQLFWCVIAVDWRGYPSQDYHVLRASLLRDGRSISLLSRIVHSKQQNNTQLQNEFLDTLAEAINTKTKVIIVTDAGFQNAWFTPIKSLGWDFIGRVRGQILLRLDITGDIFGIKGQQSPGVFGGAVRCRGHLRVKAIFIFIVARPQTVLTNQKGFFITGSKLKALENLPPSWRFCA